MTDASDPGTRWQPTRPMVVALSAEHYAQFTQLAEKQDVTIRFLLGQAINGLFTKYGIPAVKLLAEPAKRNTSTAGKSVTHVISTEVPRAMHTQVKALAHQLDRSMQSILSEAVSDLFEKNGLQAFPFSAATGGQLPARRAGDVELRSLVDTFIAENGDWQQFVAAKDKLRGSLRYAMKPSVNQGVRSYRDDLTMEDVANLTHSAVGLGGEFGNGLGMAVQDNLLRFAAVADDKTSPRWGPKVTLRADPLPQRLGKVVEWFDKPSQLMIAGEGLEKKLGIQKESAGQALSRSADEAERWIDANQDALDADSLRADLTTYRAALDKVNTFVDTVRNHLAQMALDTIPSHPHSGH